VLPHRHHGIGYTEGVGLIQLRCHGVGYRFSSAPATCVRRIGKKFTSRPPTLTAYRPIYNIRVQQMSAYTTPCIHSNTAARWV